MMTPCESRGWREGDVFIIKDNYGGRYFKIGDEVVLYIDDASTPHGLKAQSGLTMEYGRLITIRWSLSILSH